MCTCARHVLGIAPSVATTTIVIIPGVSRGARMGGAACCGRLARRGRPSPRLRVAHVHPPRPAPCRPRPLPQRRPCHLVHTHTHMHMHMHMHMHTLPQRLTPPLTAHSRRTTTAAPPHLRRTSAAPPLRQACMGVQCPAFLAAARRHPRAADRRAARGAVRLLRSGRGAPCSARCNADARCHARCAGMHDAMHDIQCACNASASIGSRRRRACPSTRLHSPPPRGYGHSRAWPWGWPRLRPRRRRRQRKRRVGVTAYCSSAACDLAAEELP